MNDLKLENLMPIKNGLVILEKFGLKNVKIKGEASSVEQEQQTSSQTPLKKKSLSRKDICLNKFQTQTKVPYSGGGGATKDIY